jgi:glycosyltransferase involved in cell wall biosynthesis
MNFVFVNHVHPETPHVSSMRMRLFADALTRRGHRVVLLTHPRTRSEAVAGPAEVERSLMSFDWRAPFHLSCPPIFSWRDSAARSPELPRVLRRVLIFANMALRGGLNDDWVQGSRPYWPVIERAFRPDLVWGIFGDPSSLRGAQLLARRVGVPWVADFKDHFEIFIHPLARRWIASRYADAAGFSSNSRFHEAFAARSFHTPHAVVYSGVAPSMIAASSGTVDTEVFRIMLVGSLYDGDRLRRFFAALGAWLQTVDPADRDHIELTYAGSDRRIIEPTLSAQPPPCRTRVLDQLPLDDLGRLCQSAALNAYIWSPRTFHHKLLELLACRRPVVSFPGEAAESIELAAKYGGDLRVCKSEAELQQTFSSIWDIWRSGEKTPPSTFVNVEALTWDAMAEKLEAFFVEISKFESDRRALA